MRLELVLKGSPEPKQGDRSRIAVKANGKQFVRHYTKESIVAFTHLLQYQIKMQLPRGFKPFEHAVVVHKLQFVFAPPVGSRRRVLRDEAQGNTVYKETKPDLDNLEKLLWDACQGLIYCNDSRIVIKREVSKVYGAQPRTILTIGDTL